MTRFMDDVWEGVKAQFLSLPLQTAWIAIGVNILLQAHGLVLAALIAWWAVLGAYVGAAMAFARAQEADARRGRHEAARDRLMARWQETLAEVGRQIGPVIVKALQGMREAMVALGPQVEAWAAEQTVARRRREAEMMGVDVGLYDLMVAEAREKARTSGESFLSAFNRGWDHLVLYAMTRREDSVDALRYALMGLPDARDVRGPRPSVEILDEIDHWKGTL